MAHDDGKKPDTHLAMKSRLPGGVRTQITSLAVLARAGFVQPHQLFPTPTTQDAFNAGGGAQMDRKTPPLNAVARKLLPTPVVTDSYGSRRSTARTEEWKSNAGTTLTDALWESAGRTTDTKGKLLPTPTGDDANNVTRKSGEYNSLARSVNALSTSEPTATPSPDGSGSEETPPPAPSTSEAD